MKSFTISKNDSGQRVDKFILKTFPKLPKSLMFKEIRKKNIKVNRKRTDASAILNEGDILELYLKDDVLQEKVKHYDFTGASKKLDIIYEDENIILLDKKVGLLCHPDGNEYVDTLISRVKRYLYEKGEWNPEDSSTFSPSLANRIDRNTGGIVIAAKNAEALRILNEKIKSREIEKYYLTVVHGRMEKESDTLTAYLTKDTKKNKVAVSDKETDNSKKIVTKYTVLDYQNGNSLLEIDLKTGRTHQIRAHMAYIDHPLLNDGKYGKEQGRYRQALYSYKLVFNMKDAGILSYLDGRQFEVKNCELIHNFKENKYI
ncbi:MAG: RluA family pseudouridine synthase [Eubacterium sp.]|nr:RluA family pseudouridine synthase [Eubacterium sp.]